MRRLLMMYDDHGIRAALTVVLERGFDVTTAATASEGLYRLTGLSPDLVVLDMATLDLDPAAFLSGLRARRSGCPVIVVNADGRAPGIAELTALALDGLLFKPFELDKLLERIDSVLGARGAGRLCPRFSGHVSRSIQHLAHHYGEPLTVDTLATTIGVSASHLAHLFVRETGRSVRVFLAQLRVEVAKRLLTRHEHKLEQVAELSGFCDASHFSRVFRQHVGCRPGEYRRALRDPGWNAGMTVTHIFFLGWSQATAVGSSISADTVIVRQPRRPPSS